MIRLSLTDPSRETPEVRAWLDAVAVILSARCEPDLERLKLDLLIYGVATLPIALTDS